MAAGDKADIVVIGLGAAGAAAAITANDLGANVVIVEKAHAGGGSTEASGGNIRAIRDIEGAIRHFATLADQGTPRDVVEAQVHGLAALPAWLEGLGAKFRGTNAPMPSTPGGSGFGQSAFPEVEDSEALGGRLQVEGRPRSPGGESLWEFLDSCVKQREISVLYNSPAKRLVREDGRIVAVEVGEGAEARRIGASKGVILTCGGFNWAHEMHIDLFGTVLPALTPPHRNSGDGIRMAQEIGAQLWHMSAVAARFGYKFPEYEAAFKSTPPSLGFFYVDQLGRRFVDETGIIFHAAGRIMLERDVYTGKLVRCPSFMVFDETMRLAGPIGPQPNGYNRTYDWSADNSVEIERGWIHKGNTMGELAEKIGVPAAELERAASRYNAAIRSRDDDFRRAPEKMEPVEKPPFYAVALWPCLLNTQGGPRRNARAEVLDVHDEPIPGLFSAGELGSMWGQLYPGAGNIGEALVTGQIAAKSALETQSS